LTFERIAIFSSPNMSASNPHPPRDAPRILTSLSNPGLEQSGGKSPFSRLAQSGEEPGDLAEDKASVTLSLPAATNVDIASDARTFRSRGTAQSARSKARANHLRSASRLSNSSFTSGLHHLASEAIEGFEPIWAVYKQLVTNHRFLLLGCLFLIALGVVCGIWIEGWDFLTSLYVIVQISTTIGYGDCTVERPGMQLFMTFYVLATLFVVANFLNIMLKVLIERQQEYMLHRLVDLEVVVHSRIFTQSDLRRRFRGLNEMVAAGCLFLFSILIGTIFFKFAEDCTCSYGVSKSDFDLSECDDSSYETCMATGGIAKTWISSFYMSVITVTTVGFGDLTPKSRLGRACAIPWMLLGVVATAFFLQSVSNYIGGVHKEKEAESHLRRTAESLDTRQASIESLEEINQGLFNAFDVAKAGRLTKAEYTRYVLVQRGYLPIEVLKQIDDQFDRIDVAGRGSISLDMIQEAATRLEHQTAAEDNNQSEAIEL